MFGEILKKIEKSNDQRMKMALTLINVMKQKDGASIEIRTAVAASLIDMMQTDMMEEDVVLISILNEGIDSVCEDAKNKYGVENLRDRLKECVLYAKKVVEEKMDRVEMGDNILKSINLN